MEDRDCTREPAKIERLNYDDERGSSVHVMCVGRDGGWGQGFGGYLLPGDARREFVSAICETFGVADPELLVGQECYLLRCWDRFGGQIEGLESEATGRRFIAHDWLRERFPDSNIEGPLEREKASLRGTIEWATRRVREAERDLLTIEQGYVRWGSR